MKLLSIAIPSYNSQDYMRNCIDSLLTGGEEVEILIMTMVQRMRRRRSRMSMQRNILPSSGRYTRRTAVMERRSTPASAMPQDFSTRWWTVMTG